MKTSDRKSNFYRLKDHALIGKWYSKMAQRDLEFCLEFIENNTDLCDTDFIFKVNRMYLNVPEKPKAWAQISDLLSASIDPIVRRRGRLL